MTRRRNLEAENLVVQLGHRLRGLVAKRASGLLHGADHGRRTTDENLYISSGSGTVFLGWGVSFCLRSPGGGDKP